MPGYNHYPSCPCGWCAKGWSSRSGLSPVESLFSARDATHLLKRHRIRSRLACYVNPNARCPVCNEPVFFYANAAGSRVFFDDLGPPWPKHPCTDRQALVEMRPIERRSAGLMQELVKAANTIGMLAQPPEHQGQGRYRPIVVLSVSSSASRSIVTGEYLDTTAREPFRITVQSTGLPLSTGDIIGQQDGLVSYVDPLSLRPMQFREGGAVEPYLQAVSGHQDPAPTTRLSARTTLLKRPDSRANLKPAKEPRGDLTKVELRHFGGDEETLGRLLATYGPLIRAYAREQVRKPPDVCQRLNREGHKTMAGAVWTTRLVYFLLKLLFDKPRRTQAAAVRQHTAPPSIPDHRRPSPRADHAIGGEGVELTMMAKLERLGRVTVAKPRPR
jgi:hypothetical protein